MLKEVGLNLVLQQKWLKLIVIILLSAYISIILEKYDDFWGEKVVIEKVFFKVIEDDLERKNLLLSGMIDIVENIKPIYIDEIIDKNSIIYNVRKGYAEPASQFITPLIFGYNPDIEPLEYNLNESLNLLKEAGYEDGFNITLDCPFDWYDDLAICEEIVMQLKPIINVTLNPLSIEDYFDKILNRNSSFYIIGWIPTTGDGGEIFDYILRSVDEKNGYGTYNLGYYSNSIVDDLSDIIMVSMDPEIRLKNMQDGFRIAMEDIACIPLFISVLNYGVSNEIEWTPRSDMDIRIENIKIIN